MPAHIKIVEEYEQATVETTIRGEHAQLMAYSKVCKRAALHVLDHLGVDNDERQKIADKISIAFLMLVSQ